MLRFVGFVVCLSVVAQAFVPFVPSNWKKQVNTDRHTVDPAVSFVVDKKQTRLDAATVVKDDPVTAPSSSLLTPKGARNQWEVHKFGGASLATAELYRTVGDLLLQESQGQREDTGGHPVPTMAVVSARGGMTDLLVKVVDSALVNFDEAKVALQEAVESQIALLRELAPRRITRQFEDSFRQDGKDILSVVQSLRMLQTVPAVTMEVVTGYGEIWSAQTLYAYLQTKNVPCDWMDARDILIVESDGIAGLGEKGSASTGGVTPLWTETTDRLHKWWESKTALNSVDCGSTPPIVVVTGFVAKTLDGVPTTLKRSGSDYSATIFGKLCNAARVTMWKNTDGVYTADPRRVPEAFPIASLKYDEACELAYFGAQVLHPSAMDPVIDYNIPVYVRNIFNPSFAGTVIQGRCKSLKECQDDSVQNWKSARNDEIPIKGITSVDKIALVTLEGATLMGGANVARRFMGTMSDNDVTVLIITQASSESSITVAVPENEGDRALRALEDAFELELARSKVNSVSLQTGMSIVAIVGEGMALKSGVSSTFMRSLAQANVNIRLIAQGSSERQIAVVVEAKDTSRALRAAHMAFTLSETEASVTVLGATGAIGSALVDQFQCQTTMLAENLGVALSLKAAASSERMVCGFDAASDCESHKSAIVQALKDDDAENVQPFDLDGITEWVKSDVNPLRIIVDCTNTDEVGDYYQQWLAAGVSVVSPGRKVGSGCLDRYHKVTEAQTSAAWLMESSVGSALPIITTLQDLTETGDNIKVLRGSLSGTMAYVLSTMSEDVPFSEAVQRAKDKGYTENDLKEDLSGLDMTRKVVILARLLGLEVKLEDVEVDSLLSDEIMAKDYTSNEEILKDLKTLDAAMLEKLQTAQAEDKALRYKFEIHRETGTCRCKLEPVASTDPLFRLKRNENLVAFETSRYETSPLIVKGAAAGPDLAAAGVFADILRLARGYSSNQS